VRKRGRGKIEGRYEEKNAGPSTPLKDVAIVYFLLPLTNGPKTRRRMEGQKMLCIFFVFSYTLATEELGSDDLPGFNNIKSKCQASRPYSHFKYISKDELFRLC
jgi:hypothetical protein